MQTATEPVQYEQVVLMLMRQLSPEKQAVVLDFVSYLADRSDRPTQAGMLDREKVWQELEMLVSKARANASGTPPEKLEAEITAAATEVRTTH
jgi:hypothetical protein